MTTLYRPVKITSAEQAEALPEGTIARHAAGSGMDHAHKLGPLPGFDNSFMWISLSGPVPSPAMVGWTALVPIEAEEERGEDDDADSFTPTRRLVTPWEEA